MSLIFASQAVALTSEQMAQHEESFRTFDVDGSGGISAYELMNIMKALGRSRTADEIFEMISHSDLNADQLIDFSEFVNMMLKGSDPEQYKQEIERAFGSFDRNGDGYVGRAEIKKSVSELGDVVTDTEIDQMLAGNDLNDDLLLDYSEFESMMLH
jgi:calmodulin